VDATSIFMPFRLRSRQFLAPGGLGIRKRVEHELAPGKRGVHGEVSMAGTEADWSGGGAVAGAVAAVAEFGQPDGDA